jgi:hypothetical protein
MVDSTDGKARWDSTDDPCAGQIEVTLRKAHRPAASAHHQLIASLSSWARRNATFLPASLSPAHRHHEFHQQRAHLLLRQRLCLR